MKSLLSGGPGQGGAIVMITLLILAVLSLSSLMAVNMAVSDSSMMRNSRIYRCNLYRAETGITQAQEVYATSWLAPDSDLFDLFVDDAEVIVNEFFISDENGDDMTVMGRYTIARIEKAPVPGSLSEAFYRLGHQAPMPLDAGFSAVNFEIRRYGILSTGTSQPDRPGVTVEAGLYKVFNNF